MKIKGWNVEEKGNKIIVTPKRLTKYWIYVQVMLSVLFDKGLYKDIWHNIRSIK